MAWSARKAYSVFVCHAHPCGRLCSGGSPWYSYTATEGSEVGLNQYRYWVSGIGTDTSSPVVRLPVSTVNTVATHAYSFKLIGYCIFVHTPRIHIYTAHTYTPHKIAFSVQKKFVQPSIGIGIAVADSIGYRAPAHCTVLV